MAYQDDFSFNSMSNHAMSNNPQTSLSQTPAGAGGTNWGAVGGGIASIAGAYMSYKDSKKSTTGPTAGGQAPMQTMSPLARGNLEEAWGQSTRDKDNYVSKGQLLSQNQIRIKRMSQTLSQQSLGQDRLMTAAAGAQNNENNTRGGRQAMGILSGSGGKMDRGLTLTQAKGALNKEQFDKNAIERQNIANVFFNDNQINYGNEMREAGYEYQNQYRDIADSQMRGAAEGQMYGAVAGMGLNMLLNPQMYKRQGA